MNSPYLLKSSYMFWMFIGNVLLNERSGFKEFRAGLASVPSFFLLFDERLNYFRKFPVQIMD